MFLHRGQFAIKSPGARQEGRHIFPLLYNSDTQIGTNTFLLPIVFFNEVKIIKVLVKTGTWKQLTVSMFLSQYDLRNI